MLESLPSLAGRFVPAIWICLLVLLRERRVAHHRGAVSHDHEFSVLSEDGPAYRRDRAHTVARVGGAASVRKTHRYTRCSCHTQHACLGLHHRCGPLHRLRRILIEDAHSNDSIPRVAARYVHCHRGRRNVVSADRVVPRHRHCHRGGHDLHRGYAAARDSRPSSCRSPIFRIVCCRGRGGRSLSPCSPVH